MFRGNFDTMSRPPSACFVAPLIPDHAVELAQAGWRVQVLWTDTTSPPPSALAEAGVHLAHLDAMHCPASFTLAGPNLAPWLYASDQVRCALAEWHQIHRFDFIDFGAEATLAFRSVQAKRLGLDFADVSLLVCPNETGQQRRHLRQQWLDQPDDLAQDYGAGYAVEHADVQMQGICFDPAQLRESAKVCFGETSPKAQTTFPLVTVSVAYYNLAPYLGEALASLATQTYSALEVLVINDGSTDPEAILVFEEMRSRYPQFQFVDQANTGIGATRNRGLDLARGEYFLPMDADNVARPDMVARLVAGLECNPDLAALTSYFLAFADSADLAAERFLYAYKPTGGPHILGCLRNVYGDGNALFRTAALRASGGFTTDRDCSWEDWEVFVKLVNAGHHVDVLPDFLFYYRHRDAGFSRVTSNYRNHQRVLRQYIEIETMSRADRMTMWNLLAGMHLRLEKLADDNKTLQVLLRSKRYQIMDRLGAVLNHVPGWKPTLRWLWNRWHNKKECRQLTKPQDKQRESRGSNAGV